MAVLAKAAEGYAEGGYFVVVDGIVGPWFIRPFKRLKQPLHYIVLRPTLEAALERCRLRGDDTLTDPEPISALHRQFSMLGEFTRQQGVRVRQAKNESSGPRDLTGARSGGSGGRFVVLRSGGAYDAQARDPNRKFKFEKAQTSLD
jgi:hypothetical protein